MFPASRITLAQADTLRWMTGMVLSFWKNRAKTGQGP